MFGLVGDRLVESGYRVVITGMEAERPIAEAVMAHMRKNATDLVGRTDLGALAALLSQSALLIANDTGVSHMAAALHVPSVIVCIGSDPIRWSPHDRCLHRVLIGQSTTVNDVIAAVHALEPLLSRSRIERGAIPYYDDLVSDIFRPDRFTESRPPGVVRSL